MFRAGLDDTQRCVGLLALGLTMAVSRKCSNPACVREPTFMKPLKKKLRPGHMVHADDDVKANMRSARHQLAHPSRRRRSRWSTRARPASGSSGMNPCCLRRQRCRLSFADGDGADAVECARAPAACSVWHGEPSGAGAKSEHARAV